MLLTTLQILGWLAVGLSIFFVAATAGFDFGAGILSKFVGKTDDEKRTIINAVAPTWDGNQVWFIIAGGLLFAVFPQVYASSFSGLYFAILLVLWALFLRPVAFEYRHKIDSDKWRGWWDWMLLMGSLLPVLVMGVAVGNIYLGFPIQYDETARLIYGSVVDGGYSSMWYNLVMLLTPFALYFGIFAVVMILMHGAAYCAFRTGGVVRQRCQKLVRVFSVLFFLMFLGAAFWLVWPKGFQWNAQGLPHFSSALNYPWTSGDFIRQDTWYHNYFQHIWMWIAPIVALMGALTAFSQSGKGNDRGAFVGSVGAVLGSVFTMGFALFPFLMPSYADPKFSLTLFNASSSTASLVAIEIVAAIMFPVICMYTYYVYSKMWKDRRITPEEVQEKAHELY